MSQFEVGDVVRIVENSAAAVAATAGREAALSHTDVGKTSSVCSLLICVMVRV